ncbi:hypothetical protein LOD99_9419 [Oopsacas minuta]|uniref:Uncharacterized protein n=1 Tax=Oopsacas minuta TaxID=111878 RepID=A0AAV7JBW2_9METZ|nr:hypothetical protein LOD99_9419 [Oopsacas minuta]
MSNQSKPKILKSKPKLQSVSTRLCSPKSDTETRRSERSLKEQLQLLENENSELRYRLDSLRRAKNQLIIKREKVPICHSIRTSSPSLETQSITEDSAHPVDLLSDREDLQLRELELERLWQLRQEEVERNLIREHEEEIQQLQRDNIELRGAVEQTRLEKSELIADFEIKEVKWLQEIQQLETKCNSTIDSDYQDLGEKCRELRKLLREKELRADNLLAENSHLRATLDKREEEWRVREEELSLELRNAWGKRYHEWITKAERKMQELQEMNQILQNMVEKKPLMLIVLSVASRLVSEVLFLLSGMKEPDPSHVSLLRYLSEYLPLPTYGIIYIQIPVERLANTSSTKLLFGSNNKTSQYYRSRVSRRIDLSSSFNRSNLDNRSLDSVTDSDCVEVWDSEISFTSDCPTVHVASDPQRVSRRPEVETAYNGDDELSVPESAAEQKIVSLMTELVSLKSQLASIILDKELKSQRNVIPDPPPDIPIWFTNRITQHTAVQAPACSTPSFLTPVSRQPRQSVQSGDRPNMVNVLEGIGSVKLKCVSKSPGGTPLRLQAKSPKPGDDPGAIIAYALKKRFANILPAFNEDEEISTSEDLDHTFS